MCSCGAEVSKKDLEYAFLASASKFGDTFLSFAFCSTQVKMISMSIVDQGLNRRSGSGSVSGSGLGEFLGGFSVRISDSELVVTLRGVTKNVPVLGLGVFDPCRQTAERGCRRGVFLSDFWTEQTAPTRSKIPDYIPGGFRCKEEIGSPWFRIGHDGVSYYLR